MVAPRQLTDKEWLLLTSPDDSEEAPWMTMPDFQWRIIALLMSILQRYRRETGLPWYIAAELKVTMPRQLVPRSFDLGPDLLMAEGDDHPRDSWHVEQEGRPPFFVLEVVTPDSGMRDTREKPLLYDSMGVQEYLIFAPKRKRKPNLSGYRRTADGLFVPWQVDGRGQLRSEALGGLLFSAEESGGSTWLRARTLQGRRLLSDAEAAEQEAARAEEEAARADQEAARAEEEAARAGHEAAARHAAEERAAALAAELARLRALHPGE